FHEDEGLSLVVTRFNAEQAEIAFDSTFRLLTLKVHSSLEAVGLTAAVSGALAEQGISANVVAAYHHDHILVPAHQAHDALAILQKLGGGLTK
ncbi:MAG: ACT domain-containing protein, partial [Gammaproteobacteria bacterium]|nr:ACT domain-containing protein [Gammaproteobacteria bacterium]